jgi:DNA-binding CsgD family transcriptional regulator
VVAGEPNNSELTAVLVLRALTPSRLRSCLRLVTNADAAISPELLCRILPEPGDADSAVHRLTDREYDVLRMLADGDSTREIAEQLSYSERTVKNVVRDLLAKLGCRTRAHAVALAARQGAI